jgi:hypothetical protein
MILLVEACTDTTTWPEAVMWIGISLGSALSIWALVKYLS